MRSSVERQSRVGIGQGCTCSLLQAAPTVPLAAAVLNKNNEFQCLFEIRDDLGQGTAGGTKNRAATPKDVMNQNENL